MYSTKFILDSTDMMTLPPALGDSRDWMAFLDDLYAPQSGVLVVSHSLKVNFRNS